MQIRSTGRAPSASPGIRRRSPTGPARVQVAAFRPAPLVALLLLLGTLALWPGAAPTASGGAATCHADATRNTLPCASTASEAALASQAGVFEIRCQTFQAPADTVAAPLPLGAPPPSAIGVLPAALVCQAGFWAGATLAVASPGTIEVSTRLGTLLDLRGSTMTTLRVGCGPGMSAVADAATASSDGCRGVRFGVVGLAVGSVDLRARYEPTGILVTGTPERETATTVAFVAPTTRVLLTTFVNPIGVGETTTASFRFNRTNTVNGQLLINPATGGTLRISLGTPLNGVATFTSSDPAVASFAGGLRATTVAGIGTAADSATPALVAAGGASISARCGSAVAGTARDFSSYFGGCEAVDVTLRANAIGTVTLTATFRPDLPDAFPDGVVASTAILEVVRVAPSSVRLTPGCTNVAAPATETVDHVLARVAPAAAAVSVWRQSPGATLFQAAMSGDRAPPAASNLVGVSVLDAIFVCVSAAATFRIT